MDFEKFCSDVMNIHKDIRFAMVIRNGRKVSGGYNKGVNNIIDDEDLQMSIFYAAQRWETRKNLEHKIGKTKYAMSEYETVKRITFPVDDKNNLLLVSIDVNADHNAIIDKALTLIRKETT